MKFLSTPKILIVSILMLFASSTIFAQEDVVLQWHRVLTTVVRTPGVQPATINSNRSYSMMHAAMFDAINSIEGTYTPYLISVPGTRFASTRIAGAKAAYDVLSALYPTQQALLDAEFLISLDGMATTRNRNAMRIGEITAAAILTDRNNDGWAVTPPPFVLPPTPGNWQPTPPGFVPAALTHYGAVKPFTTTSSAQFRPNPPPSLTSAEYTADFNEEKELGSATSTTRSADQTLVARLWASGPNSAYLWFAVARDQAISRNLSTAETARLFALLSITYHDTLQTSWASKYVYGLWRPVTAIRRADEDGNPDTAQDPNWTSLIVTPPYPTYAGNASAHGMSQAVVLGLFFGRDDTQFQATFEGPPVTTRSYSSFSALADEQARSRVYGGIHFTFDNKAGQSIGRNVANYVFTNYLKRRECTF